MALRAAGARCPRDAFSRACGRGEGGGGVSETSTCRRCGANARAIAHAFRESCRQTYPAWDRHSRHLPPRNDSLFMHEARGESRGATQRRNLLRISALHSSSVICLSTTTAASRDDPREVNKQGDGAKKHLSSQQVFDHFEVGTTPSPSGSRAFRTL